MKLYRSLFLIAGLWVSLLGVAQKHAPEDYLVRGLNYQSLQSYDQILLDSAIALYKQALHDSDRIHALHVITDNMMDDSWRKYNDFSYTMAKKKMEEEDLAPSERLFFSHALTSAINNQGYIAEQDGEITTALSLYHEAMDLAKKDGNTKEIATALNNIALIYNNQGDVTNSLEYFHKSLKLLEELSLKNSSPEILSPMARSLNNVGFIYFTQGDSDNALDYYQRALEVMEKLGDKQAIASTLGNMGSVFKVKNYINKSLEFYAKALDMYKSIGDKEGVAGSHLNIGNIYKTKGDYPLALQNFEMALAIDLETNNKEGIAGDYAGLSSVYYKQDNLPKAKEFALKSYEVAKQLGFPEYIKNAAELLSSIYRREGRHREGWEMYELYIQMRDSSRNVETEKEMTRQQMRYNFEKVQAVSEAEHDKELEVSAARESNQRVISIASGLGLILVLIFALIIFNRLNLTRKQKSVIEEQKRQVEETHHKLSEKNREVMDSIHYAKRIQSALLKSEQHESKHLPEHFILFKPKDIVSGDFYWAYEKNDHLYVAAADCTGHGVPGAFLTMLGTAFLNEISASSNSITPAEILNQLRGRIIKELSHTTQDSDPDSFSQRVRDGMDISLCRIPLPKTNIRVIDWAGANNPLWIVRKVDLAGEFEEINPDKQPIGLYASMSPFTNHQVEVKTGDMLYLFTDGFADQFGGPKGKKFMYKQLKQLMISIVDLTLDEQKQALDKAFLQWRGELEQIDDVCVIGIRI